MAKTKLLQSTRESLLEWMFKQAEDKLKAKLSKVEAKAIEAANKAIRVKYPEKDMEVLRKYKCTRRDNCLRFVTDDGHFFGVEFEYEEQKGDRLADLPMSGGCRQDDVFPASTAAQNAMEAYTKQRDDGREDLKKKRREYFSFLAACKFVEDVDEVVKLPDDLRQRYFTGGALVALNPDVVASIKSDFKSSVRS
jgi:hypothetical protein